MAIARRTGGAPDPGQGVEDWVPGGAPPRATTIAEVDGAEFTLDQRRPLRRTKGAAPAPAADLNAIDFEGLVALGISVGQAARFISQRERRGGISSLHELDGFYGLAPGVRDLLRSRGRV